MNEANNGRNKPPEKGGTKNPPKNYNISVLGIVQRYLIEHGFDGLWNGDGECACELGDINPCDEMSGNCVPGYKTLCDCGEHDWHIVSLKQDAWATIEKVVATLKDDIDGYEKEKKKE